jgi:probable rRNA maturation factor
MTIRINSQNLNKKRKIDLSKAEKAAKAVLAAHKKDNAELNIVFVGNQKMRALNRKWFGKDRATDVIAWPAGNNEVSRVTRHSSRKFLGDIAVSSDMAARNAGEYGLGFEEELTLYVIHGTLHLLGYNDGTPGEKARIRKEENGLLQKVKRHLRRQVPAQRERRD